MAAKCEVELWEEAKEELPKMQETVIGGIIGWVRNTIIVQAVTRLLAMFTPVGAIIEAGRGIYNTIMFFVRRANEVAALVNSIFGSITNVAHKKLGPAIKYIEKTMASGLTLTISFLARYIGLGGIPDKIKGVIGKVKKPVDKAIGKATDWIASKVKVLVSKVKGGFEKVKSFFGFGKKKGKKASIYRQFSMGNKGHELKFENGRLLMASEKFEPVVEKLAKFENIVKTDEIYKSIYADKLDEIEERLSQITRVTQKLEVQKRDADSIRDKTHQSRRIDAIYKRLDVVVKNLKDFSRLTGLNDVITYADKSPSIIKERLEQRRRIRANVNYVDAKEIFNKEPYDKYNYADPRLCGLNRFLQYSIIESISGGEVVGVRTRPHGVRDAILPPKPGDFEPEKGNGKPVKGKKGRRPGFVKDEEGRRIAQVVVSDLDLAFYAAGGKSRTNNASIELGEDIDINYRNSGIKIKNYSLKRIVFGGHGDNHNGMFLKYKKKAKTPIEIAMRNEVIYVFNSNGFVKAGRYQDMIGEYIKNGFTWMQERIKYFQEHPEEYN